MILIAHETKIDEKKIIETLNFAGGKLSLYLRTNDLFNSQNINKIKQDLYYAFLDIPKYWSIHAAGINGAVYDGNNKKANIYFKEPIEQRNVGRVEWHDEKENVYRIDYYNEYGYRSCIENVCDGNVTSREYFDQNNNLRLIEQVTIGTYTIFEENKIKKTYISFADLLKELLDSQKIEDRDIWLTDIDILKKFNGKFGNFKITYILENKSEFNQFKEQENIKDIRILCNNEEWINRIKENTECRCGRLYLYNKKTKRKIKNKEAFILTETDQIEYIEKLIRDFPRMKFNIAASTYMSDTLNSLEKYENVSLYPCVSEGMIKKLFDACSIYLDINHYREIYDAVNSAVVNDLIVFAFDNTVHRLDLCLDENVIASDNYERMHEIIKKVILDEAIYDNLLKKQEQRLKKLTQRMFLYEENNENI